MQALILQIIVALLIAGFFFWAAQTLVAVIPMAPPFPAIINAVLIILAVAIVLFYVVIPLIEFIGNMHIPLPSNTR